MDKVVSNIEDCIEGVKSGMTLMFGGFGLCGIPEKAIECLSKTSLKDLICISNDGGAEDFGLGLMMKNRQIKKMVSSYLGYNKEYEREVIAGEIEVDLVPQGTLAERCRAGGAGIPAFYTPTGFGTEVGEGKTVTYFNDKPYILEEALSADYAFVKAWKGDRYGNLIYKYTALNFNHVMATAGKITVAEVEEIVEPEELDPNFIHTPGIFVQKVFCGKNYEKRIERLTTRPKNNQ